MKKLFICEYIGREVYDLLKERFEIISDWNRLGEADGLIRRNFDVTREIMEKGKCLKVIGVFGTGLNGIDLEAAKKRGIDVFAAPGENAYSVAELIISLMLDLSKRLTACDRYIRQDKIRENAPFELMGCDLRGKSLGLIGTGNIAKQVVKIAKGGFDMKVLGWSEHFTAERAEKMGVEYADSLERVMSSCDFISISVPLTDKTVGLIGKREMELMKPSSFLINTARGRVIDEDALYDMLKNKRIAGAGCDVFYHEPPRAWNRLFELDNFVGTPHIGDNTEEALYRVGMVIARGMTERLC